MRIDEELLEPSSHGPWSEIAKNCSARYRTTTGSAFDGELLEIAATVGKRPIRLDRVAWGFARRAVSQMRATCEVCGARAKPALGRYRSVARCAECQLPVDFRGQLQWVLGDVDAGGEPRPVWTESQLPPLLRLAVPGHLWRQLQPTTRIALRYLTAKDLQAMTAGLMRLATLLEDEAKQHAARRLRRLNGDKSGTDS